MIYSCQAWIAEYYGYQDKARTGIDADKAQPIALLMDSDISVLVHMFALMGLGIPVSI